MHRRHLLAAFCLTSILVAPAGAWAQPAEGSATAFIAAIGARTATVLRGSEATLEQREATLQRSLRDAIDLPAMTGAVLDRTDGATADQRAEFQAAFAEYVLQTLAPRFGGYAGDSFATTGEQAADGEDVLVATRLDRPAGGPLASEWRVRQAGGQWRIVDVAVDGASLVATRHQRFTAALQQPAGIDGVTRSLQARAGKLPAVGAP